MISHYFHPDAGAEFEYAALYYESQVVGLGKSFIDEVERIILLIRQYPDAGSLTISRCRQALVDRFPYSVVYRRERDTLVIVAVAHQ